MFQDMWFCLNKEKGRVINSVPDKNIPDKTYSSICPQNIDPIDKILS